MNLEPGANNTITSFERVGAMCENKDTNLHEMGVDDRRDNCNLHNIGNHIEYVWTKTPLYLCSICKPRASQTNHVLHCRFVDDKNVTSSTVQKSGAKAIMAMRSMSGAWM